MMSNIKATMAYPNPDDVQPRLAEAIWDIHRGQNLEAASKYIKGFFGTIEWVLRTAEEVYEVNSLKFNAAEKLKFKSAFTGVPVTELKRRKKAT
jgi:hypothetical protein